MVPTRRRMTYITPCTDYNQHGPHSDLGNMTADEFAMKFVLKNKTA